MGPYLLNCMRTDTSVRHTEEEVPQPWLVPFRAVSVTPWCCPLGLQTLEWLEYLQALGGHFSNPDHLFLLPSLQQGGSQGWKQPPSFAQQGSR